MTERLEDRLARLELERLDADKQYNDALTRLDRALPSAAGLPDPPPPYDTTKLPYVNQTWDILATGAPIVDTTSRLTAWVQRIVWKFIGPLFESQRRFNAALVEHLNRNVVVHEEARKAAATMIEQARQHVENMASYQSAFIQYLQTITLYVDTKDRSTSGDLDVLNAGLSSVTDTWLRHWETLGAREDRFVRRLEAIDDLRATTTLAQQTALSLKREVEKLIENTKGSGVPRFEGSRGAESNPEPSNLGTLPPDLNAFKYLGFEDQFRGSQADIRQRLAGYVALFDGQSDVLDVGCGRGEFLELLQAGGITARGLDLNQAMVEASRARGLDAVAADALRYVTDLPDESIGGLFAAQVVEHLQPDYLMRLLETAAQKIRPGGLIVLETINPACWVAFFESYIRDLTHVRPLHPETLQYVLRVSGFHNVTIDFKSPVDEAARLQPVPVPPPFKDVPGETMDLVSAFNENVAKLNARIFTFQDYAAIGRK